MYSRWFSSMVPKGPASRLGRKGYQASVFARTSRATRRDDCPGKERIHSCCAFRRWGRGAKAENRKLMFTAIRELNASKLQIAVQGETHSLWSGPSKPAYLRAQDQLACDGSIEYHEEIGRGTPTRV